MFAVKFAGEFRALVLDAYDRRSAISNLPIPDVVDAKDMLLISPRMVTFATRIWSEVHPPACDGSRSAISPTPS